MHIKLSPSSYIVCMTLCLMQALFLTACGGQNRLMSEQVSPTGTYKAELWEGDSGAVGTWMSAVKVSESNPSLWSRVLRRDEDTIFGVDARSTHIGVRWLSANELEITCGGCSSSQIRLQKPSWQEITVFYHLQQEQSVQDR
jgi:hypothetical protein